MACDVIDQTKPKCVGIHHAKGLQDWSTYTVYHLLGGRGFVCIGLGPCTLAGLKTKHTKPLPSSR